jgi:hypothetical protein
VRDVENEEGAHLGRALAGPVSKKFEELTAGRYKDLRLDATLRTEAMGLGQSPGTGSEVLSALSVGTRNQLATLIRLTIAAQLKSAIVLDDHLVHTDPVRLAWFQEMLTTTALNTQVIVLTCRPEDYLKSEELPVGSIERDLAGGTVRAVDVARAIKRWAATASDSSRPWGRNLMKLGARGVLRPRGARPIRGERTLRVFETHSPGAHARVQVVLDTVLLVKARRRLGPEVGHVIRASELQGNQVVDLIGARRLPRRQAVHGEHATAQLSRDIAPSTRRRVADDRGVRGPQRSRGACVVGQQTNGATRGGPRRNWWAPRQQEHWDE